MKNKGNNIISIVVSITLSLIIGLVGGYLVATKTELFSNDKTEQEKESKIDTKDEVKGLDINTSLAKELYYEVKEIPRISYIENNELKDYIVSEESEQSKMKILAASINEKEGTYLNCNQYKKDIPDEVNVTVKRFNGEEQNEMRTSICSDIYKDFQPSISFEKKYIEYLYKKLYGNNAKLDTSAPIPYDFLSITMYKYIEQIDQYVLYKTEAGSSLCGGASGELEKATISNDEVKLYEKVSIIDCEIDDKRPTKTLTYVYTFKKDNNSYKFLSAQKQQ